MNNRSTQGKFAAKIVRSVLPGGVASVVCGVVAVLAIRYVYQQGQVQASSAYLFMIVCGVIAAAACVISIVVPRQFVRQPMQTLEVLTRTVRHAQETGDIRVPDELRKVSGEYANEKDEISEICAAFVAIMNGHAKKTAILEQIAKGDLSARANVAGELDALGNAINAVIANLSRVVSEVSDVTAQFSIGVRELANGAQSLAQSSAEQAATVDQLQVSVGDIASEAEANAAKAARAQELTATIRENAGGGRKQVERMSIAMREIAGANHSIGSVMRTIDDIAFQTNILALNAAVEAARAGVHGRGFAVVADEVRNLANKSGSAAGESNAVIVDTIAKSDDGLKIVEDALAFFQKIEEGIVHTSDLLDEIAVTAKNQSDSIDAINTFIANLTNVVLLNNATSEQSAAASEEMSSRAVILEKTVNKYKLADAPASLPKPSPMTGSVPIQTPKLVGVPAPAAIPEPAFLIPKATTESDKPAGEVSGGDGRVAPVSEYDPDVLLVRPNPVNEPVPEAGGRTPAEIYAEALGEVQVTLAPASPAAPASAPAGVFKDDESKYW